MKLLELIDSLAARLKAINTEQAAIETEAEKGATGRMSAEQTQKYDTLQAEYVEKDKELSDAKAEHKKLQGRKERAVPEPVKTKVSHVVAEPVIGNPKLAAEDDPKKGFKTHREFLGAVMAAGGGRGFDERLALCVPDRQMTVGSDEAGGYSDPYGGFLMPAAFSPNLLSVMAESDPLASLTTKVPMEAAVLNIPARTDKNHSTSVSGGLRVYRRAETDDVTASRMQFEQVTLAAHSLFGVAYATEELLARSPMSFIALLEAGFKDEFAAKLVDERLNGTGAGMYEGVVNAPCTVSVAKESGQAAATITKTNVDKMAARQWRYGQSVWLANHNTRPALSSLVQTVGTGGAPVPYFAANPSGQETLLGRPIFFSEFCATLGTTGDIINGTWSQYLEGILSGASSAESVHVRFLNHERTFKFWMENDGRCWWRSALTPRSGDTLSPFVKLDTRA